MKLFNSFDRFTKFFIITAILIAISTPFIANNYQIFNPQAAEMLPPDGGSSLLKPPCQFRFANEAWYPPGYGDVNLDGQVSSVDNLMVLRIVARLPISVPTNKLKYAYEAADVNGEPYKKSFRVVAYINGEELVEPLGLDSGDALRISRYVAKLDKGFPACAYTSGLFIVN